VVFLQPISQMTSNELANGVIPNSERN